MNSTSWPTAVRSGDGRSARPKNTPKTFAFMECFDYPFYATLDVRFYGSMPLIKFWPDIDKQELRQFADTVPQDLTGKYIWIWKTQHDGIACNSACAR